MNDIWDKLEDNLNPILFNDLRKTVKAKYFWLNIAFLLIVYLIVFFVLIVSPKDTREYILDCYRVLSFFVLVSSIAIPLELRILSLKEASNDNIFFVFMSNITANKLIKGKFLLGILYNIILLIAVIPIYFFIYFTDGIDFFRLIKIYFINMFIPIPVILLLIHEGINDGKNKKLAQNINGITQAIAMFANSWVFVYFGVMVIRDEEVPFFVDLILAAISLIISGFTYLFLYSYLTKTYPLSEGSSVFIHKSNNIIRFKSNNVSKNSINKDNESKLEQDIKSNTSNSVDLDNNLKSSSSTDISLELNNYKKHKIKVIKKERISTETIIKIILTLILVAILFAGLFVKELAIIAAQGFLIAFPFISAYIHSRDNKYDRRSKLEIPDSTFKRIIKFPFASGYANGVVWLSLICVLLLFSLLVILGLPSDFNRYSYSVVDSFKRQDYLLLMGFMLNIFSWCFIARFFADLIKEKEETRENKYLNLIFILIVGASLCTGLIPKREHNALNALNYLVPVMPMLTHYYFFKKHLALVYNLFFFILTIIPNLKTIYKQIATYFSHQNDFSNDYDFYS